MSITTLGSKQPFEEYLIQFDFANDLGSSEDAASAEVSAIDLEDNSDVTDTVTDSTEQVISGTSVYVWVLAGTDKHNYKITCKVTGDSGSKYELEAVLPVAEV